jgi:phosphoglycolate phosphatase
MINPNDVNLIIFDTDGTIVPSLTPVYEAIKIAFARLNWPVTFRTDDIKPFFGLSAPDSGGGLYGYIRPQESDLTWEEIRDKILDEYPYTFREYAALYPGVKETLGALRKQGYRLAQYSNGSVVYLNTVIDTLGIRGFFDHIECVQENGLTKTGLVRKIREKFGGLTAAVVGDRRHDIEAARETASLAVGALYGYGDKEPEQADVTINKFGDLLSIFNRKTSVS